jgi:hypothetical protein
MGILHSRDANMWSTNQAQFDEHVFPFRKRMDNSVDILFQAISSGLLTIACTQAVIQGYTITQ